MYGREAPNKNVAELEEKLEIKDDSDDVIELGYWRKHPNLHGYMVVTFMNGVDECQEIELKKEHIETIIRAVKDKKLPLTTGFFFGHSLNTQDEIDEDLKYFNNALTWLNEKPHRKVFYRASW